MTGSIPLLSYFMALVLTLGTLCCPLLGLARLMEAARIHEAEQQRLKALQEARRRAADAELASIKQAIAQKFAASSLGRPADNSAQEA